MAKADTILNKVFNLDSRKLDQVVTKPIIDVTITSPPYHDLKDYGSKNQIGFGQSYNDYLNDLEDVFRKVYEKTKISGTLWVIIDAYRKNKEIVALPFDFAKRMQNIGWKFKDIIIWSKDRTVPWAHSGQMRKLFEFILVFSKEDRYKFFIDRVRESENLKNWWIRYPERYNPKGKAPEEIWKFPIPTQGSWGRGYISHFCPLPENLVRKIILLTTNENDLVFDPFAGTGTVPSQAIFTKRKYLGFELNQKYIKMFDEYVSEIVESKIKEYSEERRNFYPLQKLIIDLRILKYARLLIGKFSKEVIHIYCEKLNHNNKDSNKRATANYHILIVQTQSLRNMREEIFDYCKKAPLSKFGIKSTLYFYKSKTKFVEILPTKGLYYYKKENSHKYIKRVKPSELTNKHKILSKIKVNLDENKKEKKE